MSYKPLPDNLTIKESSIHGLGLFATKDIEWGYRRNPDIPNQMILPTYLGTSHIEILYFQDGKEETLELIRTPLGGFINHSDNPNVRLVQYDSEFPNSRWYYIYLLRDIKAGEEITLDYDNELCGLTDYKDEEWIK